MTDDPNWPRADVWLQPPGRGAADLVVLGVPMRLGSISGGRFDLFPRAVRSALSRFSTFDGETDIDGLLADDAGDLEIREQGPADAFALVRDAVADAQASSHGAVCMLGGDNSVTNPGVQGLAAHVGSGLKQVGLVTLDAHHDLRDTTRGLTNGNPVRALLENGLLGENVWQIGIQPFANSAVYAQVAKDAGIRVVTIDDVRERGIHTLLSEALGTLAEKVEAIYVDLDVDVLDRAFAPACPGSRPGGLMSWELHEAARIAGSHPKVRAIDIVEVDPTRDVADITVMNAARCLLSFASGLSAR